MLMISGVGKSSTIEGCRMAQDLPMKWMLTPVSSGGDRVAASNPEK